MEYANPDLEVVAQAAKERLKESIRLNPNLFDPNEQGKIRQEMDSLGARYGKRYVQELLTEIDFPFTLESY